MSLDKPECHNEYAIQGWTIFGALGGGAVTYHWGIQNGQIADGNIFRFGLTSHNKFVIKRHSISCFNGAASAATIGWGYGLEDTSAMDLVVAAGVFVIVETGELNIVLEAPSVFHRGRITFPAALPGATTFALSTWMALQVIKR